MYSQRAAEDRQVQRRWHPPASVAPEDAWLPAPADLAAPRTRRGAGARADAVAGPSRLRVVIADSDPLARRVVRDVFERTPGFVVAAEAESGIQAIELALHYRPDVVLIEAVLPGVGGIEAVRRITERAPEVRLVVFSVSEEPELALAALRAGRQRLPVQARPDRGGGPDPARRRARRGGDLARADAAARGAPAQHVGQRQRHAPRPLEPHHARVGDPRPDDHGRVDAGRSPTSSCSRRRRSTRTSRASCASSACTPARTRSRRRTGCGTPGCRRRRPGRRGLARERSAPGGLRSRRAPPSGAGGVLAGACGTPGDMSTKISTTC